MIRSALLALLSLFAACTAQPNWSGDGLPAPAGETYAPFAARTPYPLDTCLVSGKPLGDDAVTFTVGEHTFRTCCAKCQAKIEADPTQWVQQLDQAIATAQLAHYPLTTCPISGEQLGSNGQPVQKIIDGTLVQLCCSKCNAKAQADGSALAQQVRRAAFEQQLAHYALSTCPVSGKPLGEHAVATMFGTTLVRTCCSKCADEIAANPTAWLPKVEAMSKVANAGNVWVYPLETCVVSGKPLGDDAVTFTVDGQTFKTCCAKCKAKVEADAQAYAPKVAAATAAAQLAHYPLTTCPISGEQLGKMGAPVQKIIDGTLVQLCCEHCEAKAAAKGNELVTAIRRAAVEQQFAHYPLTTCPVSGEPLGDDAVSTLFGTTLVRTCCSKCVAKIAANPGKWLPKVEAAWQQAPAKDKAPQGCCDGAK